MNELRVKLTFTEPVLGTASGNPELHREYIASKAPDAAKIEDEVASLGVDAVEEKQMTLFPKLEDGTPFVWDYQIRGFFKSACKAMNMADGHTKLTAYKTKIDQLVFIKERKIPFVFDGEMGVLQRPLRAETAQGPRVALASSETIPAGATIEFTIMCLNKDLMKNVIEWLDYGIYSGLGQWRSGSYGRFTWEDIGAKDKQMKRTAA